ncbi:MAG: ArnT family glycosyltransferase, partial [Halobacteriota archaeon]
MPAEPGAGLTKRRTDVLALLLASASAVVSVAVSRWVFPYLSTNDDEGVYLQQAEMLLDGRLVMHAGDHAEFFRPWFFVVDGGAMYPKYTPVTAAVFAFGEALGGFEVALAAVSFAVTGATYLVVSRCWERRTGLLAALLVSTSALFVVQSGLYLSYAPTAAFNLGFAYAYLRSVDDGGWLWPSVAGACFGLAWFSRPYTALLFAAPFAVHAAVVTARALRGRSTFPAARVYSVMALPAVASLALALLYNAVVTGDALVFPYLEFAPQDGPGFGERRILGHARDYTPSLALEANARVLWRFVVEWGPAAPLGVVFVALGAFELRRDVDWRRALVVGVGVSVVVGNLYFWGNLNLLGDVSDPADGLLHLYGPLYHYDLLVPFSALAAAGVVSTYDVAVERFDVRAVSAAGVILVVVLALAGGFSAADRLSDNAGVSDALEPAYEPFDGFSDGLVFMPTPYGDWLNHPWQAARNHPSLEG